MNKLLIRFFKQLNSKSIADFIPAKSDLLLFAHYFFVSLNYVGSLNAQKPAFCFFGQSLV